MFAVAGVKDPETFKRLLGDLNSEFGRLSQQVQDLTQEGERLRRENCELNELVLGGLKETFLLKSSQQATTTTSPPPSEVARTTSLDWSNSGASPRSIYSNSLHGEDQQDDLPEGECRQWTGPTTNSLSAKAKPVMGDVDVKDELGSLTSFERAQTERTNNIREQFKRLDEREKGFLSSQECFSVVSQVEAHKYGHVKHDYKKVVRAIRTLNNKVYPERVANNNAAALDPVRGSLSSQKMDEAGIDEEAFCTLMEEPGEFREETEEDEERLKLGPGGDDMAFLRKVFEHEAAQHQAQLARHKIAQKDTLNKDPEATGWLRFVLETMPPFVICANTIEIGLETDIEAVDWSIFEYGFAIFYLTEFILKIRLIGCHRFFRGQEGRWNTFDFCCLLSTVSEQGFRIATDFLGTEFQGMLPLLKVARLFRLARIVRSFRYKMFEDLKSMVWGVFSGARVLCWSIVLLFLVVYMLGVFMAQTMSGRTEFPEFRNVPSSMFTVFRCFTDGCTSYGGQPLQEQVRQILENENLGGLFMISYILMFLIVTVGVFNLIMAIFIDNVVKTTMKRKQHDLGTREDDMKLSIEELLIKLFRESTNFRPGVYRAITRSPTKQGDLQDRSRCAAEGMAQLRNARVLVTRDLFNAWLTDSDMLSLLDDMEIDTATKFEIFDVCDVDKSGSLTPDELVSGLMRLRGPISKCDIIAVRLKVRYLTDMLEDIHHSLGA